MYYRQRDFLYMGLLTIGLCAISPLSSIGLLTAALLSNFLLSFMFVSFCRGLAHLWSMPPARVHIVGAGLPVPPPVIIAPTPPYRPLFSFNWVPSFSFNPLRSVVVRLGNAFPSRPS